MAIWTACRKHAVLCWPQLAVNTCWTEKVCSLQIRVTNVRMKCAQFYSFKLDTSRSAVVMGPRDKRVWNCTAFISGATQRMSQDRRNSVFEQPIFIAQYHDLAQKMTFKPRATIFLHSLTNYRVIQKSLRDFRTRLRNNQARHGRKEHINRYRISPKFFLY